MVFLLKQKTAYEMRISDWSSDVGSADLAAMLRARLLMAGQSMAERPTHFKTVAAIRDTESPRLRRTGGLRIRRRSSRPASPAPAAARAGGTRRRHARHIGKALGREAGGPVVYVPVVPVALKKKNN